MINNNVNNPLDRYFAAKNKTAPGAGGTAADMFKQIKAQRDAILGQTAAKAEEKDADAGKNKSAVDSGAAQRDSMKSFLDDVIAKGKTNAATTAAADDDAVTLDPSDEKVMQFLNDMPLFDQFKQDLMKAYKSLDGASAGMISAQFEFSYSSMEMIANEAGGYDVKETAFNFKLDFNYVKAASGKGKNASLSDIFGLDPNKKVTADDLMAKIKDYFSPKNTAGRIVDFATSFFPNSKYFKEGGDTEEARSKFADLMRDAVQKGFDQAMGTLGKVPKAVQDGIDETHRLTFEGIDDFVKNGLKKDKVDNGTYAALEAFTMSKSYSYSQKSYSVSAAEAEAALAKLRGQDDSKDNASEAPTASQGLDAQA